MKFKKWLENKENDFDFFRNLILNYLGLDLENGLSQDLNYLNKNNLKKKLQSLGEFSALPDDVQNNIFKKIEDEDGTIGDLIKLMSFKSTARH